MLQRHHQLVISEPDLEAALKHLRALPHVPVTPLAWDRQRLLGLIKEGVGPKPSVGETFGIAPGVFAIVKPFGVDLSLASGDAERAERRLQIWLAIRAAGTDPKRVVNL